jgi:hypothetical protein
VYLVGNDIDGWIYVPAEKLQQLLQEVTGLRKRLRETNIFSIGSQGYYENPTSDLLALFLDPAGVHGLGDLLLSSLGDLLPDQPALSELEEPPTREYQTKEKNRIDILLNGSSWVIVIENKLSHHVANPLAEYQHTVRETFSGKRHHFIILAPDDPSEPGWLWISYRRLLVKAREKLGARLVAAGISKWGVLLREFLLHIEDQVDQLGEPMDDEEFKFIQGHYSEVIEVMALHDRYIKRLIAAITRAGAQELGADPARVSRNSWGDVGIALRLYPKADREHNCTFLVLPYGGFRIQFYVETKARRPPDASRDLFTDDGRFAHLGEEQAGRFWSFYKDEPDFDGALNTFRESLRVLRDNTQ